MIFFTKWNNHSAIQTQIEANDLRSYLSCITLTSIKTEFHQNLWHTSRATIRSLEKLFWANHFYLVFTL